VCNELSYSIVSKASFGKGSPFALIDCSSMAIVFIIVRTASLCPLSANYLCNLFRIIVRAWQEHNAISWKQALAAE
jgi:hypothetical protein